MKKKWFAVVMAASIALSTPVQIYAAWKKTPEQQWQWSESGVLATGWKQINGTWYHFDAMGNMSVGWLKDGKNWYYLKADGSMKTGWLKDGGQWYYLNANGAMATGWKTLEGKSYYLNGSGKMVTGWQQIDGKWYHMTSGGVRESGWTEVNGQRYFLDDSGIMQTGVVQIDGKTYFLGENGQVLTGKLWVDGVRYSFADTGEATGNKKPVPEKAFDTLGNRTEITEEKPTLTGKLWVDGVRYSFADTGEATGNKKPVPEKAFDTLGNRTEITEEKPTLPDKDNSGNTHTGGTSGWYPGDSWNPGGNTGDGGNSGGTVNPDPEEPDDGDQGGTENPDPEEKLRITVQNGSWKETVEGLEFTVKDGYHLGNSLEVHGIYNALYMDGVSIDGFTVRGFKLSENQMSGNLRFYDESDVQRSVELNRVFKEGNIYTLKFGNLDHTFTLRLKVSDDYRSITWMDVFTSSFEDNGLKYVSFIAELDAVPDTAAVVYTENELRSALSDASVQRIVVRPQLNSGGVELEKGLIINRSVAIELETSLRASQNWQGGNAALISVQNGACVRLTAERGLERISASKQTGTHIIDVVDGSLDMNGIQLYSQAQDQTLLYLKNANVRIYNSTFYGSYQFEDTTTGIVMDTEAGSKSTLEILIRLRF